MIVKVLTSHWNNARNRLLDKAFRPTAGSRCAYQ
jgi:hypothetical protein